MSYVPPSPVRRVAALAFAALVAFAIPAGAPAAAEGRTGVLALLPANATTTHALMLPARDGRPERTLAYTAETGTLPLYGGRGEVTAEIFHVAYRLEGAGPERPVTFVFNGGPGAASAFLHIGALGPKVIETTATGDFPPPPARLVDNPDTWLAFTDLVFVDPVGTGYSRATDEEGQADRFFGVERDAAAMGAFIRLWLQEHGRLGSPIHLAGESYGGFRVALLARTLQEDVGLRPSGAVLISPALEFAFVRPDSFDILTYALTLPSMAAAKLEGEGVADQDELRRRLAPVESYALGGYLAALASGLEAGGRAASAEVAAVTGLPEAFVAERNARIEPEAFVKESGRGAGTVASLYDAGLRGPDVDPASPVAHGPDPVLDRSVAVLTGAFVRYLREDLSFPTVMSYRLLAGDIAGRWDYDVRQGYAGAMGDLQRARALNPDLAVAIVHGYTDLVTPYMVTRHLLAQLPTLSGARPIRFDVLPGGHMLYFRADGRAGLAAAAASTYAGERDPS